MNDKLQAFQNVKTIADFKQQLEANPEYVYKGYFHKETLDYALSGLDIMTEENKTAFLGFIQHIDRKMSMASTAKGNSYHKIPTALAGAIYYAYFPENIEGLNYDIITILAKHLIPKSFESYSTAVDYYGKELLGVIHELGTDFMSRDVLMDLADIKLENGETKDKVVSYMTTTPIETLKQESYDYIEKSIEIAGRYL